MPLDYTALFIMNDIHAGQSLVARVPLLRLLRLVRDLPACWPPSCVLHDTEALLQPCGFGLPCNAS